MSGQEWVGSGRTVEEAVAAGLRELGVERSQVDVEVLAEPERGRWGFWGRQGARVLVRVRRSRGEAVRSFLEGIAARMGVKAAAEVEEDGEVVTVRLSSPEASLLIGRHGGTLQALQVLAEAVAARAGGEPKRVWVDVGGYRERRRQSLEELARRMARYARRTGRRVALHPMPAYERRIVHLAIRAEDGVTSESEGEEPHRRVVIRPALEGEGKRVPRRG